MAEVFLGLGSNLGRREEYIQLAIAELPKNNINVTRISSFLENDAVGGPPQGKFLNVVLEASTELSPEELLTRIQQIETQLGRVRTVANGPRTIDIDILLYDHKKIGLPHLTIPHPRMLERKFVMIPLREIAPQVADKLKQR